MNGASLGEGFVPSYKNHRKIRIENFRSLDMEDPIEIKPITLLFGKNGSGKSSFMKAIRFLGKNLFPLKAGATNYQIDNDTDLLNFKEIVCKNDLSKEITFEYDEILEWENIDGHGRNKKINYKLLSIFSEGIKGQDFKSLTIEDKELDAFMLKLFPSQKNESYDEKTVEEIPWVRGSEAEKSFRSVFEGKGNGYAGYPGNALFIKRELPKTKNSKWKKFHEYLDILPFATPLKDLGFTYYNSLADKLNFTDEDMKILDFYIQNYLLIIPELAEKFFIPFTVGPIREKPKSKYLLENNHFNTSEYYGILNRIDEYYENYNKFYPGNQADERLDDYLSRTLVDLGLGKKIQVIKKNGIGSIFVTDQNGAIYNLAEASSGLIQILPILINEYSNNYDFPKYDFEIAGSRLNFLEKPELHLHPSLQMKLIDYLAKSLNTYVIETNSEHILSQLQVLISAGKIKKESVSIYNFENEFGISKVREMKLSDNGSFIDSWANDLLSSHFTSAKILEWQRIVDEMAHSINTDVFIAVSNLKKHKDLPRIQKAFYHTKQIRDLTNLLMWYIKRNELEISGEMSEVNVEEVINIQLKAIKEGISTLRLSADEHQENILKMEIPIDSKGKVSIRINKEISDSLVLILKDILRNAIKNTKVENPQVKIKLIEAEKDVHVEIWNNEAISENYSKWFNNEIDDEPQNISKSSKVGLRVIKMWIDLLKIKAKLIPNYQNNSTTAQIIFPKEIRYEKD